MPEENGIKNLTPNTTIYYEGEKIKNISIVTKGDIDVYISSRELIGIEDEEEIMKYSCKLFSIPRNIMIGIGDFMYDSNYIFSPVNENGIENGRYNGAYIYQCNKDGHIHYFVSRSIINPNSYAHTYNSLEGAKAKIDDWNNTQTLR